MKNCYKSPEKWHISAGRACAWGGYNYTRHGLHPYIFSTRLLNLDANPLFCPLTSDRESSILPLSLDLPSQEELHAALAEVLRQEISLCVVLSDFGWPWSLLL
jgi:hypothetical protein